MNKLNNWYNKIKGFVFSSNVVKIAKGVFKGEERNLALVLKKKVTESRTKRVFIQPKIIRFFRFGFNPDSFSVKRFLDVDVSHLNWIRLRIRFYLPNTVSDFFKTLFISVPNNVYLYFNGLLHRFYRLCSKIYFAGFSFFRSLFQLKTWLNLWSFFKSAILLPYRRLLDFKVGFYVTKPQPLVFIRLRYYRFLRVIYRFYYSLSFRFKLLRTVASKAHYNKLQEIWLRLHFSGFFKGPMTGSTFLSKPNQIKLPAAMRDPANETVRTTAYFSNAPYFMYLTPKKRAGNFKRRFTRLSDRRSWWQTRALLKRQIPSSTKISFFKKLNFYKGRVFDAHYFYYNKQLKSLTSASHFNDFRDSLKFFAELDRKKDILKWSAKPLASSSSFNLCEADLSLSRALSEIFVASFISAQRISTLVSQTKRNPVLFLSPLAFLLTFWSYRKVARLQSSFHYRQLLDLLLRFSTSRKLDAYDFSKNTYWFRNTEATSLGHDDLQFLTESGKQRRTDWAHDHFVARYGSAYATMHIGQYHYPILSLADRVLNGQLSAHGLRLILNISPVKVAFPDIEYQDRRVFSNFVPNRIMAFSFATFEGTFLLWKKPLMFADYTKNGSLIFRTAAGDLTSLPSRSSRNWVDEEFYRNLQLSHNRTPVWDELVYGQLYDISPLDLNANRSYVFYKNQFLKFDTDRSRLNAPSIALLTGTGSYLDWSQSSPTLESFMHQFTFMTAIVQDPFDDWEQRLMDYDVPLAYVHDPMHWQQVEDEEDNEEESADEDLIAQKFPSWMTTSVDSLYNLLNLYRLFDLEKLMVNENEGIGREFIEAEDYVFRTHLGYDDDRLEWDPLTVSGSYVFDTMLEHLELFFRRVYSFAFYLPQFFFNNLPYLFYYVNYLSIRLLEILRLFFASSDAKNYPIVILGILLLSLFPVSYFWSSLILDLCRLPAFAHTFYFLFFAFLVSIASILTYRFINDRYIAILTVALQMYIFALSVIFGSSAPWPYRFDRNPFFFFPSHNIGNFDIFFGVDSGYSKWYRWFWTDVNMMDTTWRGHEATNLLFYKSKYYSYRFPFHTGPVNSQFFPLQISHATHKPSLAAFGYLDNGRRTSPVYGYFKANALYHKRPTTRARGGFWSRYFASTELQNISILLPRTFYRSSLSSSDKRYAIIPYSRFYHYFFKKTYGFLHYFKIDNLYKRFLRKQQYRYDPWIFKPFLRHRFRKVEDPVNIPRYKNKYEFDKLVHMRPLNDMLVHSREGLEVTPFLLKHLGLGGYIEKIGASHADFTRDWAFRHPGHMGRKKYKRDVAHLDDRYVIKNQLIVDWLAAYHHKNFIAPQTRNMQRFGRMLFSKLREKQSDTLGIFASDFFWDECFVYNKPLVGQGLARRDLAARHYYDVTSASWQTETSFFGGSKTTVRLLTFWTELKRILGFSGQGSVTALRFPTRALINPGSTLASRFSRGDSPVLGDWQNYIALKSLNSAFGNEWLVQARLVVSHRRRFKFAIHSLGHYSGRYSFSMRKANALASMLYYGVKYDKSYWRIHRRYKPPYFVWTAYHYTRPVRFRFSIIPRDLEDFYMYRLHRHGMNYSTVDMKTGWLSGVPYFYDYAKYHFDERKLASSWGEFHSPFIDFTHRAPLRVALENRVFRLRNADPFLSTQIPLGGTLAGYEEGLLVLILRFESNLAPLLPLFLTIIQWFMDVLPDPIALALEPDWSFSSLLFNLL